MGKPRSNPRHPLREGSSPMSKNKIRKGAPLEWTVLFLILFVAALPLSWAHWRGMLRSQEEAKRAREFRLNLPELNARSGYVTSQQCLTCHPGQHDSWSRSYHRTMTQTAEGSNVLGDFNGQVINSEGLEYKVYQKDDEYWANMPDPDVMMLIHQGGRKVNMDSTDRVDLKVMMTTGSHHYQTYWVESPRFDRLMQTLPLIYLPKDKRWIPREAAFMRGPDDTGRFITQWNHHCIRCHSTSGNPGLDDESGMLNTEVAELGISCEACHGPGEEHVKANQDFFRRYSQRRHQGKDPTIINPARLDHKRSSQVCGQCHGVFITRDEFAMAYARDGEPFVPGDDLHKTRYYIQHPNHDDDPLRKKELELNPDFFAERWWDDGSILAGGREFTAMSVSGCYQRGEMSCLSCHSMHESDPADQLKPEMRTNRACVQCHTAPEYNSEIRKHTFHAPDSSGSECMNCHMPHNTYALLGAIRSHQIQSPTIEKSIRYGTPNACNLCHLDKTLEWAQMNMHYWYGTSVLELTEDQRNIAASVLWIVQGHAAQRVIAGWSMGWEPAKQISGEDWIPPILATLLSDSYGVVRYVGEKALRTFSGLEKMEYDFLADKQELLGAPEKLRQMWPVSKPEDPQRAAQLLITEQGILNRRALVSLLQKRDNRSVTIKE